MSIPAVIVAETVRGVAADAPVNRIVKAIGEVDMADEPVGRVAGRLLGAANPEGIIEAL